MDDVLSAYSEHTSIFGAIEFSRFREAWEEFQQLKGEREMIRFEGFAQEKTLEGSGVVEDAD